MSQVLKVMVVDDTITYRMIMKKVVETIPGTQVVATAPNGKLALGKIGDDIPHVVCLDVEMPEMDGLTTLQHIKQRYPQIAVIMVSGVSRSNANIVMECLNAGALDFVTKPMETNADKARDALRAELEPMLAIIARKLPPAGIPQAPIAPPEPVRPTVVAPAPRPAAKPVAFNLASFRPELLVIGSSTGGPAALTKVLSDIPKSLKIPTLIVQHMPPVFTASLAAQLTRSSGKKVVEAKEGIDLEPGLVVLAMGGHHMMLQNHGKHYKMSLNEGPRVNECRPAVDVLFMSVASAFPQPILSVILTGMGRDGANGVDALKRMGRTYCITQEKESCVVYGMPRAVDEMGLSDESLPLNQIGARIYELCNR
ncbi:MAG: chemotaxis-specific protein-glutamate methyltransferase CheB [Magnetococcales bacterium]|nr:chemotaxis-specific protein-glutamate methyltransferase CheB [Magnetococcales bacterium]